jgi:CRISPR-associated protein Cas5d
MFARPDSGAAPTSYPAPTWSAAKGILESIAFLSGGEAWLHPTRLEVCRRIGSVGGEIRFQRYATNYGGPLRKEQNIRQGSGMQVFATVLANVCYRIYGECRGGPARGGVNARHHLQDLFTRRLKQGRCHRTPALGWAEFTCDYWGAARPDLWEVDSALNLEIPSMLAEMWDRPHQGGYVSRFAQGVRLREGALFY